MISLCGFDLTSLMTTDIEHLLMCLLTDLLYIFFVEISIQIYPILKIGIGNSLVVHWLGLCAFTAGAQVQSLVG